MYVRKTLSNAASFSNDVRVHRKSEMFDNYEREHQGLRPRREDIYSNDIIQTQVSDLEHANGRNEQILWCPQFTLETR
jgi:hypothetical protein